jgi:hypothetical protein
MELCLSVGVNDYSCRFSSLLFGGVCSLDREDCGNVYFLTSCYLLYLSILEWLWCSYGRHAFLPTSCYPGSYVDRMLLRVWLA